MKKSKNLRKNIFTFNLIDSVLIKSPFFFFLISIEESGNAFKCLGLLKRL